MAASTVPAVLATVRDRLKARPGLAGVEVFTGDVATLGPEAIVLYAVTLDADWVALGPQRPIKESVTIAGAVRVVTDGGGEDVITAARERAFAIFAELVTMLVTDPAVNDLGGRLPLRPAAVELAQLPGDGIRQAWITFDLAYESKINP